MRQIRTFVLTRVFAWIGLISIGGGRAAYFHDALVVRRRWLTHEEFLQGLTLSQILPGPTVTNPTTAAPIPRSTTPTPGGTPRPK